jgi:putative ubiquitin-RnfH superfamily antitoxin RatB of RatAB toxin-antitoxin module
MGASQTNSSGFGAFKKANTKEEELRLLIDRIHVTRPGLIDKKPYIASNCKIIRNRHQYAKKI